MNKLLSFVFAALLLLPATAGVRQLSLDDLVGNATRVVAGQVVDVSARWHEGKIVSDATLAVDRDLKGQGSELVTVTYPGGSVGEITMRTGESPTFTPGEEVIVFLKPGGPCDVYGWFRGKYSIVDGRVRELRGTSAAAFEAEIKESLARSRGR